MINVDYTLQEFAELLVRKTGFNPTTLAQMLGISRKTFYNWLNGKTTRIDVEAISRNLEWINGKYNVNVYSVGNSSITIRDYTQQPHELSKEDIEEAINEIYPPEKPDEIRNGVTNVGLPRGHWFKVINSIDAGDPQAIYRVENYTGEEAYFPFGTEKSCFALKVEGDSMTNPYGDSIPNGEYVLADLSETALPGDIIVVSLTGGRQMIKQYVDGPEDNITLRSFNPNYPDIVVKKTDVIKMVRVIGQGHFKRR